MRVAWGNFPESVRTVVAIDIGIRNFGLCLYNVRERRTVMLEWGDLAPDPAEESPGPHNVSAAVDRYFGADRMRPLWDADLWVLEEQPAMIAGAGRAVESRYMNIAMETALTTLCEARRVPYLLCNPAVVKHSMLPHVFTQGVYDDNKDMAKLFAAAAMGIPERVAVILAAGRQHRCAGAGAKRYKGPGAQFEWDDVADAFIYALLAAMATGDAEAISSRLCADAAEYARRNECALSAVEAGFAAVGGAGWPVLPGVAYDAQGRPVVRVGGEDVRFDMAYLRARLFPAATDEALASIAKGEAVIMETRAARMATGKMRATPRQRAVFSRESIRKNGPAPLAPPKKRSKAAAPGI